MAGPNKVTTTMTLCLKCCEGLTETTGIKFLLGTRVREDLCIIRRNATEEFILSKSKNCYGNCRFIQDCQINQKEISSGQGSNDRGTHPGLSTPSGVSGSRYKPRLKSRLRGT